VETLQRLSRVDVDVLEAGRGPAHGHVGQLLILEPGDPSVDLDVLRAWYAGRLHRARRFRQRLVSVPLQVHRPLWADDEDFDLDRHVRGLRLGSGDRDGLDAAVGRLLGLPLDLRRPPWEAWLLEGLEDGRVAVLTKQHLAAVDDRTGDELAVAALDVDPAEPAREVPPWVPDPLPDDLDTLSRAALSRLQRPTELVDAALDALRSRRAGAGRRRPPVFSRSLTARRQVARTTLSLESVKAVKDHHDVTVNDVMLALCAGALRRWLERRDRLPVDPLLALVPVSVTGGLEGPDSGNHISPMVSSLATDTRDPVLRIHVIADATREAQRRGAIGARRQRDWAQFAASAVLGQAGRVAVRTVAASSSPPCNLIVANIPGPTVPLFVAGAAVRELFFFGPLAPDVPLDITIVSFGDRVGVALTGCPDTDPDVGELVGEVEHALGELVATLPAPPRRDAGPQDPPAEPGAIVGPSGDRGDEPPEVDNVPGHSS
jgi:WS/DGAT/MGAT family acyltransferase